MKQRLEDFEEELRLIRFTFIIDDFYKVISDKNRHSINSVDVLIERIYEEHCPPYTRFEKARIIGSRALQISYGAPVIIDDVAKYLGKDYYDRMYSEIIDPIDFAEIEYELGTVPIMVKND